MDGERAKNRAGTPPVPDAYCSEQHRNRVIDCERCGNLRRLRYDEAARGPTRGPQSLRERDARLGANVCSCLRPSAPLSLF